MTFIIVVKYIPTFIKHVGGGIVLLRAADQSGSNANYISRHEANRKVKSLVVFPANRISHSHCTLTQMIPFKL